MAEPVTLYKGDEEITIHAPSEVQRLQGDGWDLVRPIAPAEKTDRGEGKAQAKPAPATKRRRKTAASKE